MSRRTREKTKERKHEVAISLRFPACLTSCIRDTFLSAIVLLLVAPTVWSQVSVKQIDYEGWAGCYEISNPVVRVVVVPQIGGRIMEYSLDGKNVLWSNEDELGKLTGNDVGKTWRNYGGYKAWNAPETRWQTTDRDNFYDSMPAKVELLPDGRGLRIIGEPIPHLGYQFVRDVTLSDSTSRLRLVEHMLNVSDHDISWSIWDLTQVKTPCWIAFPISESSAFEQGYSVIYPPGKQLQQIERFNDIGVLRYDNLTENWATDAKAGWMAYIKGQLAYTKRWSTRMVGVTYPDGGCDAAFYTCSKDILGGYAEMEVMGPVVTLAPGGETALIEDWFLTRLNQSARDVPDVISRLKLIQKRGLLPRSAKF